MVRIASCYPAHKKTTSRALALYSGSLASTVAVRLAEEAGVRDPILVYFRSPFFQDEDEVCLRAGRFLPGRPFRSITLKRDFLKLALLENGFPFPCGSCRQVLLRRVARLVRRLHADLVITGEVAGRGGLGPDDLEALDAAVGLGGRVLRPLSARLLAPTQAERAGKVNRKAFLGLMKHDVGQSLPALAHALGLPPALKSRQCLLADPEFVARFREGITMEKPTANMIQLCRFLRCYRIEPQAKVVVAVTKEEQNRLQALFLPTDVRLYLALPGSPLALIRAEWLRRTPEERSRIIATAAEVLISAAGLPKDRPWAVCFRCEGEEETQRMNLSFTSQRTPALISL